MRTILSDDYDKLKLKSATGLLMGFLCVSVLIVFLGVKYFSSPASAASFVSLAEILAGLLFIVIYQHICLKAACCKYNEQKLLSKNLIDCIFVSILDDTCTIVNAADSFFSIIGYTREQLKTLCHDEFSKVLSGNTAKNTFLAAKAALETKGSYHCDYKIKTLAGDYKWIFCRGCAITGPDGVKLVYTMAIDFTDLHLRRKALEMDQKRYSIVMENIDSAIFDCNMMSDEIEFSEQWQRRFGVTRYRSDFLKNIKTDSQIHPDDMELIIQNFVKLQNGETDNFEITIRLRDESNIYTWNKLNVTSIKDANSIPVRAVGIVINVDEEQHKINTLQHKAERDSLTQLYNKGTAEAMIKNFLETDGKESSHALIVIDIDNFKNVNDTLGHRAGDIAITHTARKINDLFRHDDIMGRIGGDEFIILAKYVNNAEELKSRIDSISNILNETIDNNGETLCISCSIGISIFPKDGQNYEKLFSKADRALYGAKRKGKSCYIIYEG